MTEVMGYHFCDDICYVKLCLASRIANRIALESSSLLVLKKQNSMSPTTANMTSANKLAEPEGGSFPT